MLYFSPAVRAIWKFVAPDRSRRRNQPTLRNVLKRHFQPSDGHIYGNGDDCHYTNDHLGKGAFYIAYTRLLVFALQNFAELSYESPLCGKDGRRLVGQVQRSAVQRFQQRAYDLGFRTLKLVVRDRVQADPDQAVTNENTQHDVNCPVWRAGKPYLSAYIRLQSEEVENQIEHPSIPADTLSHILVMANTFGQFLKISESDPAEEDYGNFVHVSNQPIKHIWGKEGINTRHPVDIDQRSESDYSTICVSETADSEIYNQAQQKPLSFNNQSAKPAAFDPRSSFLPLILEKQLRRQGGVFELPPPEIGKAPREDGQDIQ
jgi:hypothetical protein